MAAIKVSRLTKSSCTARMPNRRLRSAADRTAGGCDMAGASLVRSPGTMLWGKAGSDSNRRDATVRVKTRDLSFVVPGRRTPRLTLPPGPGRRNRLARCGPANDNSRRKDRSQFHRDQASRPV
jgi:hypothetical protein